DADAIRINDFRWRRPAELDQSAAVSRLVARSPRSPANTMVTFFTVPKSFVGSTKIIQDNAIGSWNRLGSGCDIVLFGNDPGVADAAQRHKTRHEPFTLRNELGTPLLSDVFHRMDVLARHPIVAF